jgi:hypothetical protein
VGAASIDARDLPRVEAKAMNGDREALARLIVYHAEGKPDPGPINPDLFKWSKLAVGYGMTGYSLTALQSASAGYATCEEVKRFAKGQEANLVTMIRDENQFVNECLGSS